MVVMVTSIGSDLGCAGPFAFVGDCFKNGHEIQFWPEGNRSLQEASGKAFLVFEKEKERWSLDVASVSAIVILTTSLKVMSLSWAEAREL